LDDIIARPVASDGASTLWDVSFNLAQVQSKGSFVHVRSALEFQQIIRMKARYPLEGVEGSIIDLPVAQRAFNRLKPAPASAGAIQKTFDGKAIRDPFTEFLLNNVVFPNPRMEYFYHYRQRADKLLRRGYGDIPEVMDYLDKYQARIIEFEKEGRTKKEAVRHALHAETFFSTDEGRIRKRNNMLSKVMALEHVNFEYGAAACPLTDADADQQASAEDINDVCQVFSYNAGKKCATYFIYTKKALKDKKTMDSYFDYVHRQKTRFHAVNFSELDLYYPVDKKARIAFTNFMKRIIEIQHDAPEGQKPQFMLWGAGHQYFIALQAFDFVSSAPTRDDRMMVDWSKGRTQGYWFEETPMFLTAPEDGIAIDKAHCPRCRVMPPNGFEDPRYNRWRREHGIHDMNNRSLGFRNAIKSNSVGSYLRLHLAASEFGAYQKMILSP
jgi:hypothetical protein